MGAAGDVGDRDVVAQQEGRAREVMVQRLEIGAPPRAQPFERAVGCAARREAQHFLAPTNLLHDGRATSVEDAILRHDGQGAAARNAFINLPPGHKNNLLAFLGVL